MVAWTICITCGIVELDPINRIRERSRNNDEKSFKMFSMDRAWKRDAREVVEC